MITDLSAAFLLTFAAIFPIVNPLESAPFFLELTGRCSDSQRRRLAWQVTINSFGLLLGSLLLGPLILQVFGIDLPIVRIAGGIILVSVAWKLFHNESQPEEEQAVEEVATSRHGKMSSFYPLTMPLTVGPGSMSIATTIGSRKANGLDISQWLIHITGAGIGILAVAATVLVCYAFSARIIRRLGQTGTDILVRLSAFLLMCVGVQIAWGGYTALISELPK